MGIFKNALKWREKWYKPLHTTTEFQQLSAHGKSCCICIHPLFPQQTATSYDFTINTLVCTVLKIHFTFFYWRIIALQCCVSFCHTAKWIRHMHTHIPCLLDLPPPSSQPTRLSQSTELSSLCYTAGSHQLSILHIVSLFMSNLISQFIPHSPSPVSTHPFSTSTFLFLPCKQLYLYHFSRFHIYALIYNICLSLSDLLHSV